MTLAKLQTLSNAKLADFWSVLKVKQEAYHAKRGKYFQLIISPSSPVIDGVLTDFSTTSPSDEVHQIDVDFSWAEKLPFQIEVHEWFSAGEDKGFKAMVYAQLPDGRIFTRSRSHPHVGGEVDSGWVKHVVEEI